MGKRSNYKLLKNTIKLGWGVTKKSTGIDTALDIVAPKVRKGGKKRRIRLEGMDERAGKSLRNSTVDNIVPGLGFVLDKIDPITAPQKAKKQNKKIQINQQKYIVETHYEINPDGLKEFLKHLPWNIFLIFKVIFVGWLFFKISYFLFINLGINNDNANSLSSLFTFFSLFLILFLANFVKK